MIANCLSAIIPPLFIDRFRPKKLRAAIISGGSNRHLVYRPAIDLLPSILLMIVVDAVHNTAGSAQRPMISVMGVARSDATRWRIRQRF